MSDLAQLIQQIEQDLLLNLRLRMVQPHDPIVVDHSPAGWQLLGTGNYAAVLAPPGSHEFVVKVYAPDRPGLAEEAEVYRRLGQHPGFGACAHVGKDFLILKRLEGTTLYDCMQRGIWIPPRIIKDVDQALSYARSRNLHPHDVHGRNVMIVQGRGVVVDVSDFLDTSPCRTWNHIKWAYYWIYRPFIKGLKLRISARGMDRLRWFYRSIKHSLAAIKDRIKKQ